jgi:two-component system, OmpR family, sensor histidine kinase MprB
MSLRLKIALALAGLVLLATSVIAVSALGSTRDQLQREVDESLLEVMDELPRRLVQGRPTRPGGEPVQEDGIDTDFPELDGVRGDRFDQFVWQIRRADGTIVVESAIGELPSVPPGASQRLVTARIAGDRYRVLSADLRAGATVQVARSLAEADRVVASLRRRTFVSIGLVAATAALAGWLIGQALTRRLAHLTSVAEHVAATGRLDVPVPTDGRDETGRLGVAFDRMLDALASSREAQHRLVQDAGHELRTPLTSVRTNVSVLRQIDQLSPDDRRQLLDDLDSETRELSTLIDEVVSLATDRAQDDPIGPVDLRALADKVAGRARRRTDVPIVVAGASHAPATGRPAALERAISNLVDNAIKFHADPTQPIEVAVQTNGVEVADRGPGIAASDLPHVFERFYRSIDARSTPGSGLGLSIVHDTAIAHGGRATATAREGGGAVVGFTVGLIPPSSASA